MSVRKPSWQITALIETHNLSTPYAECEGCHICSMIENISKETGLWMDEKPRRYKRTTLTPEKLEELLDAGYMKKDILEMTGLTKATLRRMIMKWFPERHVKRDKYKFTIDLEEYKRMKSLGMKRADIARHQNVSMHALDHQVKKWNKEAEQ